MAKRFKLKFPNINIASFQLCRLKSPSSLPRLPKPAKYRKSPLNPKSYDITYPSSSPAPPPSTPELSFVSPSPTRPRTLMRSLDVCDSVEATSSSSKKERKSKSRKASHVLTMINSGEDGYDNDDDSLVLLDSSRSFSSEQYPRDHRPRESVAVVKRSEDPYEDFKRSMLEMIMEKQMFRAGDLEELLQCFLTLNSRQYHGIIVEAFSEIWEILFSDEF